MYAEHPTFNPPSNDEIPVWRYLDFSKFVSLLTTGFLWFSRVDLLGDPHEGSLGSLGVALRDDTIRKAAKGSRQALSDEQIEQHVADMKSLLRMFHSSIFVNRWHMNEAESMAMWDMYGGSMAPVAVRSTYSRLRDSLGGDAEVHIGTVKYFDPRSDLIGWKNQAFTPYVHKRSAFAYEREIRMVTMAEAANDGKKETDPWEVSAVAGVNVPVDLPTLVESVVIGPGRPVWFESAVRAVVNRFCGVLEVARSSLDIEPVW